MFDYIGNNQDELQTKFITWTGDNSAHNVWDNSNEEVTEYTVNITNTLKEALGPDSDITVYPIVGNHDTWPVNVQDFSKPNSNWPINHFKGSWTDTNWLSEEESKVFGEYGFYSKPFEFNTKGKVIALNMQACNDLNWWLLDNRSDPGHMLQWFEDELS
jgi:sphingomyelin phosphodiesterase